ncbi:MAG: endonuclease [Pseudopedobacter saltans]|uniref:Endonuclease n=1 Tax=Pseudopedobacter saltans TaxID=151895 RepID=A0A2W5GDE5_9SPHI|nr:MAG: endonuclease [Pseudopedobacter saltans]
MIKIARFKIVFLSWLLLLSATVVAQKKNYQVVNIGFYNLENFFDTTHDAGKNDYDFTPTGKKGYTGAVYLQKLHNMASVLKDMGTAYSPDGIAVLGVSEIENENVLNDLIHDQQIAGRNYKFVHYESPDARGIDVALLYNPSYFTVETSRPLKVELPAGSHNGASATRDILYVKGTIDGEVFHFFVNHWPSRLGGQAASEGDRAIAANVARHAADSIFGVDPKANIILMGDLNDNPDNNSVTKVFRSNGDLKDNDLTSFYSPFLQMFSKGIGTLAYQDAWALFDQIIISRNLLSHEDPTKHYFFYKASIFKRDDMIQLTGRYKGYPKRTYDFDRFADGFSDHFPTFITLLRESN